jgi:hypothetical protein
MSPGLPDLNIMSTTSTVERAYALARSGNIPDFARLKQRLQADGCRAVDALLASRSIRGHLEAICAASFRGSAEAAESDTAPASKTQG